MFNKIAKIIVVIICSWIVGMVYGKAIDYIVTNLASKPSTIDENGEIDWDE